jgi:hypothetical protein
MAAMMMAMVVVVTIIIMTMMVTVTNSRQRLPESGRGCESSRASFVPGPSGGDIGGWFHVGKSAFFADFPT